MTATKLRLARLVVLASMVSAGLVPAIGVPSAKAATLSYPATADARVDAGSPGTNFGGSSSLRADGSPRAESYLRFVVSGTSGSVTGATLRLFATGPTSDGPEVFAADNSWSESAITFHNGRPARISGSLDDLGPIADDTFVDLDVSGVVRGDGTYSFNLAPTSSDGSNYRSREASSNRPQLIVTTGPGGDTDPPQTTIESGPSGTVTSSTATFAFSSDEAGSTFECSLDAAAFSDCESPRSYSGLTVGSHTFAVRATDQAGNTDPTPASRSWVIDGGGQPAVLVGAGDISSCNNDNDETTAKLLDGIAGTVFTTGDHAYEDGTAQQFSQCYDPTWGRHKTRTRPSPGNHDYHTAGAAGYFGYFGAAAGDPTRGYYSYDLGAWHVIALNSNCADIGGCGVGSAQERWLRADLADSEAECTVAYWHHPLFSSGSVWGSSDRTAALWAALYESGADLVVNAHEHVYERFAPQDPAGAADPTFGIRQFTVGTGGRSLYGFNTPLPNSQVRRAEYGVIKLTLQAAGYGWEFITPAGVTDFGSGSCHGSPPVVPPPPSAETTFAAAADARVEEERRNTNFGTSSTLRVQGGSDPDIETYLRFNVAGLSDTITDAKLRLFAFNGTSNGPAVYMTDNNWTETGITWANRRPRTGGRDDKGSVPANAFVEYDVTPFVTGNGSVSFVLATTSSDSLSVNSREASSNRPQLVVRTGTAPPPSGEEAFAFGLVGDTGYSDSSVAKFEAVRADMNGDGLAFSMHVGDIKSGQDPCPDSVYTTNRNRFDEFTHPLVYTPGDNEWRDCSDKLGRLDFLRDVFFPTSQSRGNPTMNVLRQSGVHLENARWHRGSVTFATFHTVGPDNNDGQTSEFGPRNDANIAWLRETFAAAQARGSTGVVLLSHANPGFPPNESRSTRAGFRSYLEALRDEVAAWDGPVLYVHGDTHTFRVDRPTILGTSMPEFTRVEVYGPSDEHWVRVGVVPDDPQLFRVLSR